MLEAELEMLFHKAPKANCDILDQLRTFMHWDLVCEELSSFCQQASAMAKASVSPQTCPFVGMNELNYMCAASTLAAKVEEVLYHAFCEQKWECAYRTIK